jgi:hypothetical protein
MGMVADGLVLFKKTVYRSKVALAQYAAARNDTGGPFPSGEMTL